MLYLANTNMFNLIKLSGREMGGTLVVAESGWGGVSNFQNWRAKKSFAFQYTFLPLNLLIILFKCVLIYWYFLAFMLTLQLLLIFCHKSVCVRLWLAGGGGCPLRLCKKHSMSHNLSICTSIRSMLNGLELVFSPQDWLHIV